MITSILEDSPHMAMSACYAGQDDVAAVLRLLGQLLSERVPVDLGMLYRGEPLIFESPGTQNSASIIIPVGGNPFQVPNLTVEKVVRRVYSLPDTSAREEYTVRDQTPVRDPTGLRCLFLPKYRPVLQQVRIPKIAMLFWSLPFPIPTGRYTKTLIQLT